jgi:hypothetical protein
VLQQCAALPPHLCCCTQGCTYMCVREERYSARAQLTMRDLIHTTESEVIYTHAYVYDDIQNMNPHAQRNSIYHTETTTHSCELALYCTHSSIWSVELWASTEAMCCAPSAPVEFPPRLYARVCVRRARQRTCTAHDARSHTHNRVRGHIHPCIRACRHTKYEHRTYTYLHSSAQRNSIYYGQTRPTTAHSCEQAMYCTHLSVWSVELWASAVAMCCAPSAPMRLYPRLYVHVCEKSDTAHERSSRCAIPYIQPRARSYTPMHTCMPCTYTHLHSSAQRNSIYHAQT